MVMNHSGVSLGEVRWRVGWRQYVFVPDRDTLYSYDCLDEIAEFVFKMNEEHRARRG